MLKIQPVLDRAQHDVEYRERLKHDPSAVLEEAGIRFNPEIQVVVLEERTDHMHLFLGTSDQPVGLEPMLHKAEGDAMFRQRLLADPRTVIEEAIGMRLPAGLKVSIHQQKPSRRYLLLAALADSQGELSELDLEAVAGGGLLQNVLQALGNAGCQGVAHLPSWTA